MLYWFTEVCLCYAYVSFSFHVSFFLSSFMFIVPFLDSSLVLVLVLLKFFIFTLLFMGLAA